MTTEMTQGLLDRLARVDTTSLVDAGVPLRVLPTALRPVRSGLRMVGRAVTVDAYADLVPVVDGLARSGPGDVLVIAAGTDEHAVAGELFATEALRRGLTGLVIDGRCRDSRTLATLDLPVWSRGVVPTACPAQTPPTPEGPVSIGGVLVAPGDLVVGDDDGIVVGTEEELAAAIDRAESIQLREADLQSAVTGGEPLLAHLNLDEHVSALRAGRPSRLTFS